MGAVYRATRVVETPDTVTYRRLDPRPETLIVIEKSTGRILLPDHEDARYADRVIAAMVVRRHLATASGAWPGGVLRQS